MYDAFLVPPQTNLGCSVKSKYQIISLKTPSLRPWVPGSAHHLGVPPVRMQEDNYSGRAIHRGLAHHTPSPPALWDGSAPGDGGEAKFKLTLTCVVSVTGGWWGLPLQADTLALHKPHLRSTGKEQFGVKRAPRVVGWVGRAEKNNEHHSQLFGKISPGKAPPKEALLLAWSLGAQYHLLAMRR